MLQFPNCDPILSRNSRPNPARATAHLRLQLTRMRMVYVARFVTRHLQCKVRKCDISETPQLPLLYCQPSTHGRAVVNLIAAIEPLPHTSLRCARERECVVSSHAPRSMLGGLCTGCPPEKGQTFAFCSCTHTLDTLLAAAARSSSGSNNSKGIS